MRGRFFFFFAEMYRHQWREAGSESWGSSEIYTAVQQPLTCLAVTDMRYFINEPFVHSDTHTNIRTVYDSFIHYQSDELQILQVGSLRGEQLFGNEVSLVRRKPLYHTITKSLVSTETQPLITKSYCLTFNLSLTFLFGKGSHVCTRALWCVQLCAS